MGLRQAGGVAVLLGAAALPPLLLEANGYGLRVLTLVLLFAALAQAWNIVGGLSNQMSLGHAAFFGIGAYTSTLLLIRFGLSPWLGMVAAAVLGGLAALLLSLPTMRLRGHYFALATLAFSEVFRAVANAWTGLTGGPVGLSVPFSPPTFAGLQFADNRSYYLVMLGALILVTAVFVAVRRGKLGFRLRACKENIQAAEVIGIDTATVKVQAAILSGALTSALGTLYAQLNFFFDPDTVFGAFQVSIRIALIAILGGIGTSIGPIIGALLIIPLEETANVVLSGRAAGLSGLIYGLLLVGLVLIEPNGLAALPRRLRFRTRGRPRPGVASA